MFMSWLSAQLTRTRKKGNRAKTCASNGLDRLIAGKQAAQYRYCRGFHWDSSEIKDRWDLQVAIDVPFRQSAAASLPYPYRTLGQVCCVQHDERASLQRS